MLPDEGRRVRWSLRDWRITGEPAVSFEGPGVQIMEKGTGAMAKASADGHYTIVDEAGHPRRFKVRKGDAVPDGAEFAADAAAADENVGQPADEAAVAEDAPKATTRAVGPSETTKATGPSQKG